MSTESQLAKFGLFDARVPRYTSYPTAPHFSSSVGNSQFSSWIRAIPEGAQISLYLHVPFCRRLCWFCACRTQGTQTDSPVRAYIDTLLTEIAMLGRTLPKGVSLSRLHWGGGTPTLLSPDMIREVAQAVFDVAPLAPNAEFSVEIDPNEVDQARMDALAEMGMTRASIGVQDFDPEIQTVIGRIQSFETTKRAVDMIRDHGIQSLNTDILFGLPHQTKERITESVQKLLALSPDRVALYGYAHVPWMAKRQQMIPSDALPTPQERLRLFETARRLFLWDDYTEIGIDHFARKGDGLDIAARTGRLRRNFQGYTDDTSEVLIGLGASAISRFPQGFAQNNAATSAYTGHIQKGEFATHRGHAFAGEDLLRSRMIEALMCDFRISRDEMCDSFGRTPEQITAMFKQVADEFAGYVSLDSGDFVIRPEGQALTRMMARGFDAYDLSKAGHSSAI
ncbi:oxygen-independent coproporphyrinogen III oxidase [Rhodovulum sp. FJ3]|uniref:oxygen-independent coproporphyrinogen III oxidase n=1 Tax=Rhodovulum sp. FJ3 TaxID=3079053 RepID=UPI00293DCEC7|nr:oxygen-independent coproporphyrinogen III oxidase [Rhodovulum sp. FJ3]MDV4169442.1 oxygen-independent coproporphyrinogen III oxidase [Rhodovulum sp. FJ3]